MTLTELRKLIIDYIESTEALLVEDLDAMIVQAELRIYNSIQIPVLRRNVTGSLTTANSYLSTPNDFLSVYSLAVIDALGKYSYLLDKDVNFMREAYPDPTVLSQPKYYGIFGPRINDLEELSLILAPTPDASYRVELHYFYIPESITVALSGTTWLSENFSPVLLYGALREAVVFQKGEADMVQMYEQRYMEAMGQLKRLCDGLQLSLIHI